MFFWTQFKEFSVQIELWHGQFVIKISYFMHEKCWLFCSLQARIFKTILLARACCRQEFLTILPSTGKNFWPFCPPQVRIFDYFAYRRREFLTILPTAGENFGQESLFSCFFWTNLDFSWLMSIFMIEWEPWSCVNFTSLWLTLLETRLTLLSWVN